MFGLGPLEIIVIAAIAVMIYGKRLPEVGRTVGRTTGQLRRQWQEMSREFELAASGDRKDDKITKRSDPLLDLLANKAKF